MNDNRDQVQIIEIRKKMLLFQSYCKKFQIIFIFEYQCLQGWTGGLIMQSLKKCLKRAYKIYPD